MCGVLVLLSEYSPLLETLSFQDCFQFFNALSLTPMTNKWYNFQLGASTLVFATVVVFAAAWSISLRRFCIDCPEVCFERERPVCLLFVLTGELGWFCEHASVHQ